MTRISAEVRDQKSEVRCSGTRRCGVVAGIDDPGRRHGRRLQMKVTRMKGFLEEQSPKRPIAGQNSTEGNEGNEVFCQSTTALVSFVAFCKSSLRCIQCMRKRTTSAARSLERRRSKSTGRRDQG